MTPQLFRALPQAGHPGRWVAAAAALALLTTPGPAGATKAPKHKTATTTTTGGKRAHHHKVKKAPPLGHAVTLRFFVKPTKTTLRSASGETLRAGTIPAAGDSLHSVGRDYFGSHVKHVRRPSATDRLRCTYTSPTNAKCTYQITVGDAKITADNVLATSAAGITTMAINGGTEKYQGAKGLITETKVDGSANSDLSVVVLPASS